MLVLRSRTQTLRPALANSAAAVSAPRPEPITTTSGTVSVVMTFATPICGLAPARPCRDHAALGLSLHRFDLIRV